MAATAVPLSGTALDDFLNRLEADCEESASVGEADLLARLHAQPLRADSVQAVQRLYGLWMRAGDSKAALAVIDQDGAAILAATPATQQADTIMYMALFRLQIGHFLSNEAIARDALARMLALATPDSGLDERQFADLKILSRIWMDLPALGLEAVELRHRLIVRITGRDQYRAWDETVRQALRAGVFTRAGQTPEAHAAAEAALAQIREAAPGQSVDVSDWLWLGDQLIDLAPHLLPDLQQGCTELAGNRPLPHRRQVEVQLARLAARARYAGGDLAGALDLCRDARYGLDNGGLGDDFLEYELPWLIEAGRFDEAGQRAFFQIYELENDVPDLVVDTLHARLAAPEDQSVWWPLCILRACSYRPTLARLALEGVQSPAELRERSPVHAEIFARLGAVEGEDLPIVIADAARRIAETRAPDNPWIVRTSVGIDQLAGKIDDTTLLERLLAAAEAGDMHDKRTQYFIFEARIAANGLGAALATPTPVLASGQWAYNYGVSIDDPAEKPLETLSDPEREKADAEIERMKLEAYEQGRKHFEHYFATGQGHPYDAHLHTYSMLCNNLAILYRWRDKPEEAIDLHRCGIATSPFSEHYDGIFWINVDLKDDAAIIEAAEALWHYAWENGYSRFDVNDFAHKTVIALNRLQRVSDMPLWLERLVTWQRERDQEDENALSDMALWARLRVAWYVAVNHPDLARVVFTALHPQAEHTTDIDIAAAAGDLALELGFYEKAIPYYRLLIENRDEHTKVDIVFENIAECERALGRAPSTSSPSKPWWKVW